MSESKPAYWQLLKHPNWQKRRLERLELGGFTCAHCDATEVPLHVHHGLYRKNAQPWEYADTELHVLCENCHAEAEAVMARIKECIGVFRLDMLQHLLGYVEAMRAFEAALGGINEPFPEEIALPAASAALGVADYAKAAVARVSALTADQKLQFRGLFEEAVGHSPDTYCAASQDAMMERKRKWDEMFDRWWSEGPAPRKIAKVKGREAWAKLLPAKETSLEDRYAAILSLTQKRWKEWASREADKRPYPATFLRSEEF